MAYLGTSNALMTEEQKKAEGQPQAAAIGTPQAIGGSATDVVGTGNATGSTANGGPAWTNIQAYMNANAADTNTANALENKIGTQFANEKTAFTNDSNKVKAEAQGQANAITEAQKNAQAWTQQAGAAYNYAGAQGDAYNQNKASLQNALTGQYAGPTSYTYGFGADTQAAGNALNDTNAFNQYLGNLYQDQAGGQLSSGGRALQSQLDVNNEALQAKRTELADRFKTLTGDRDQAVTDTTKALGQAQSDYVKNQNDLKDGLINSASSLDTAIAKQEADAKAAYQNAYGSKSGQAVNGWSGINNRIGTSDGHIPGMTALNQRQAQGLWSDDLSFSDLQKEQDKWRSVLGGGSSPYLADLDRNQNALNNFYSAQDSKYANTADAEERQWNFIQDVLGNTDRKAEGFKVRG